MRMKITPADAALFADELRLRDPDAFMLLEMFRFDHGDENVFELAGEVLRRDMPGAEAGRTTVFTARSLGSLQRALWSPVRETIQ